MTILGSIIEGNGESLNKKLYGSLYDTMLALVARSFDHGIKDGVSSRRGENLLHKRNAVFLYGLSQATKGE